MKPFSIFFLVFFLFTSLVATGCGGGSTGSGGNGSGTSRGSVRVWFRWAQRSNTGTPSTSQQIPAAANSVRVVVRSTTGQEFVNRVVVRPSMDDVNSTELFADLPQAVLGVEATAHESANGTGVALGRLKTFITVRANQTTEVNLSLNSTITRVAILPEQIPFLKSPLEISAAAYDAEGNQIFTNFWSWESTNPQVMIVQPTGPNTANLTAIGPGETRIILIENASGIRSERTFTVAPL